MLTALNILVAVVDGIVAVPAAVVAVEVLAALPGRRPTPAAAPAPVRPPLAVLVPAHNEHDTISSTIVLLKTQLRPTDRIVVVADNCSDDTAVLARAAGAEVIERQNLVERGKGFALDFGARHLEADPRAVVIVVDADVKPAPGALDRLAARAAETGRPVQGVYLLRQSPDAPQSPVSMLAFMVRNLVRPLGLSRLGGPCPLFGAGMAFPWQVFKDAPLGSPHLTEDVALALDLAAAGHPPLLAPDALIEGDSAPSTAAAAKQRRRWEHGHLSLILSAAPRLLWHGLTRLRPACVALALDVMVPPLSLLMMAVFATTALTWAGTLVGWLSVGLAAFQTTVFGVLMLAILAAAVRFNPGGPRGGLLWDMLRYTAGKVPLYAGFFFKRQKTWERTDRTATAETPTNTTRAA